MPEENGFDLDIDVILQNKVSVNAIIIRLQHVQTFSPLYLSHNLLLGNLADLDLDIDSSDFLSYRIDLYIV